MEQKTTSHASSSSPIWERLEAFVREQVQRLIQALWEEESTALLGRPKSARRGGVGAPKGGRNGDGKPRRLRLSVGTIAVRRPRGRGLGARVVSRVLPLCTRRTREVGARLPQLYLHGLALGDFARALRGLWGEGAPLSATSLARLQAGWQREYEAWKQRRRDAGGGVRVGRWRVGQSRAGGHQGGPVGDARRPHQWPDSGEGRGERAAGGQGVVGGRAAGAARLGAQAVARYDGRWPFGHLGGLGRAAAAGRRATGLGSSDHPRVGRHPEKTAGPGAHAALCHALCREPGRV
jgi:hypothetical protein